MMSATDDNNDTCANCGKEGSNLNTCNRCKSVKYCNAACKKKHRSKHKNKCDRRVAELHEEALFKQPPQKEDCPICFLRLPTLRSGSRYQTCCGKVICSGCIIAVILTTGKNMCPFCRALAPPSGEENIERVKKRIEVGDAYCAILGGYYSNGIRGFPQDGEKALELWHRAGERGNAASYNNMGSAYFHGRGVERDVKKVIHYYELAAMGGSVNARHNLGCNDGNAGNIDRALKHFMIAVEDGDSNSLKQIKQMFSNEYATKDDYVKALKAYQAYLSEVKSDDRDNAADYDDEYKYYE